MRPLALFTLALASPLAAQSFDPGAPLHTYDSTFDHVVRAIELPGGSVAVGDNRANAVFLLDSTLGSARQITSEGSGPGEIRSIQGMAAGAPNSFLMLDGQLRRWTLCTVKAKADCATVTPPAGYYAYALLGGDERDGFFFLRALMGPTGPSKDSVLVDRWDGGRSVTRTVDSLPLGPQVTVVRTSGSSRYTLNFDWPFISGPQAAPLPDGSLAIVTSSPYQVIVIHSDGTRHAGTPVARAPAPVGGAELDSALAHLDSAGADTRTIRSELRSKGVTVPRTLQVDPAGRLWIGVYHAATEETVVYDVLATDGRRLGSYLLPAATRIVGVGGRALYAVTADADGLERLSAYRLPRWR